MDMENIVVQSRNKIIYREGDYIIKLFDEHYSKADVLNEAHNQALVEETGLEVAKVIEVKQIDGRWAIVLEYVEGKTLAELMEENPDKIDEYLDEFVDLQIKVLSKTCPGLRKLKDKMMMKISQTSLDATTRYELKMRLEAMPKHRKLCHGDFNPTNVIVKPDGTFCLIDWAHATQGNGSADVARTYLTFCLAGREAVAKKYLALYCQKSDTAMQYVQRWMPIVAASQSVKGHEHEREFLLSWVDVVEYE
jgi:tRNA A-37 threonylcarbamoyl transferase component Bud32